MGFVVDLSIAAAWFLPDENDDAANAVMADLRSTRAHVPSLFWFETRNLFLMAERRGRLRPGEAQMIMTQLRALPVQDGGTASDTSVLDMAHRHMLSGYEASYLALAVELDLPLATLDRKLGVAARAEGVVIVGPLAHV